MLVAAVLIVVYAWGLFERRIVAAEDSSASMSAVCIPLRAATVRLICGTDVSSAVIITREGHILTVAHGLRKEHASATVLFHDGVTSEAEILLRDPVADVALLKLKNVSPDRPLTPVATGPFRTVVKSTSVIAAGYPGREKSGLSPVLRLGELLAVEATSLRTSCTLTAGDSGGPLIDLSGRLIGLHRQIGLGAESNHHIPIERIAEAVKPLLDLMQTPLNQTPLDQPATTQNSSALPLHLRAISDAVTSSCLERTVEIRQGESLERIVLGTLLDREHVATKLSELTPEIPILCRFHDGSQTLSTIVKSNVALDLCILKLAKSRERVAALESVGVDETRLLYIPIAASIGTDGMVRSGLLTRVQHAEPALPGKLGAVLEIDDAATGVRVKAVAPNSTAANARLLVGDRISELNQQPTANLDEVASLLQNQQPGDWLSLQFQRDQSFHTSFARLQHDPASRFERTEFLDGRSGRVSERRSGFEAVFQHDVALAPNQCGGPLCDFSGHVIAINIARRARESTLAIPIDTALSQLHEK